MIQLALLLVTLAQQPAPDPIAPYLERCEAAKAATITALGEEIKGLESFEKPTPEAQKRLETARAELKKLQDQPAAFLPISMPPAKGDVGVFHAVSFGADKPARSVDVLEIIDEDDAVIRAWHLPPPDAARLVPGVPTFVDLWLHGVDTTAMQVNKPLTLPQVFHATGPKSFDTTCGSRSIPQVVPLAIVR